MSAPLTNSKIESEYRARTSGSAKLYAEARKAIPAGLTHDSRTLLPYPIYAARAGGPLKWDVDGNEYVDYFGGHGALLLGHAHPAVVDCAAAGHASTGVRHELECAGRPVSAWSRAGDPLPLGHRASHLARSPAPTRQVEGDPFVGHFHGWHDQVARDMSHFDGGVPAGIP